MKVIGQLERAQLEQSTPGTLPGPASTGRVYADVTTPLAAVPRFYNGTAWLPLLTGQTSTLIQNTPVNGAVTVNWSLGLNQQVNLNGHTIISFSNPQPGQVHTLVVSQIPTENGTTTPWMHSFNFPDQDSRRLAYQPLGVLPSSGNAVYAWFYSSSIRAAYGSIPPSWANPPALPSTLVQGVAVHPKLPVVYLGQTSSPYWAVVPYSDDGVKFRWTGANATVLTRTTLTTSCFGLDISPDGSWAAFCSNSSPYIQASILDPFGVASSYIGVFSNPGTLPTGAANCLSIHPSGSHVVVGHSTTPFMSCYPVNAGAFGTKVGNPATLPTAAINTLAWSPGGDYLAVCNGSTSPYLQAWPFDPNTGFGTIVPAPATVPAGVPLAGLGKGITWHPSGAYVALAMNASPYVYVYPFNRASGGSWGLPLSPTTIPVGTPNCLQFTPDGNYLIVGCSSSPYLYVYDFSAQVLTSAPLSFIGSNPGAQVNDIAITKNGEQIILGLNASPYVMAYPVPRRARNYLKLTE